MTRVILVTVAGPARHVDVGVRADLTPAELAYSLGSLIGLSAAAPIAEHRAPPRPGVPHGGRSVLGPGIPLGESGVVDGDLVFFQDAVGNGAQPSAVSGVAQPARLMDATEAGYEARGEFYDGR